MSELHVATTGYQKKYGEFAQSLEGYQPEVSQNDLQVTETRMMIEQQHLGKLREFGATPVAESVTVETTS